MGARFLVGLALILALAGVGAWWVGLYRSGELGHRGLIDAPEQHEGERVVFSLVRIVEVQGPDRFVLAEGTLLVNARGPTDALGIGEEWTVIGTWRADPPHVEVLALHPARGRPAKKALSLLGLAVLGVLLPVWFVPTRAGLAVRG